MACLLEGKGGTRERRRYCANPFPVHGGKECAGKNSERGDCVGLGCNSALLLPRHLELEEEPDLS